MIPITYRKKTTGRTRLDSRSMTPIKEDVAFNYSQLRQDQDRRQTFGEANTNKIAGGGDSAEG
ncbi:hypothetical protein JMM81_20730 [Bacillus sp. V3B]|uniref:hypothetical protein n=1 Tax=Bacillus sp. V3B TaxID=2804915 RepID=UPI0021093C46|nr:hypothetical protein [Bacillus sp. V3B]MCQ6277302.1 hypothetical protein [Bacillus sp. V3B]